MEVRNLNFLIAIDDLYQYLDPGSRGDLLKRDSKRSTENLIGKECNKQSIIYYT